MVAKIDNPIFLKNVTASAEHPGHFLQNPNPQLSTIKKKDKLNLNQIIFHTQNEVTH